MLKHRYTKTIRKLGLFKGIKSFEEIEKQIEEHSDSNKDRGDAFEVFAEAYLTLGINLPYKAVYPENKLTAKHFKRLRITSSDTNVRGIDGALETQSDEFHTYQVKYRSTGDRLSWNDLTGSVVASQNTDALLIFTNVSNIDGDIAQRNVYSIRNDKLNDLTKDDLKRMEILIYKDQVKKKRAIKLDPYQKDAIKDVLKKLKTDARTQLIMPCGSGKTIVGQRIIESIDDAKTILVLVPTLQLLNDTFENYFNDTRWDSFPFMCVGSKVVDSRAYDQMDADPSELPMVTRTDSESVKAFLKKKFNRHIIFSTYQSLPVIADALGKRKVDVAIFDEAHNTASKKGNVWTFGLDDKNIKVKKRIFMTATPRKYQLRRKNEDDMRVVFSMDDPKIYGDIAYKLSFKKAADEYGAICRYKIIISVITSKYYTRKDLRDGDVLVGYSDVNAENIAKQIALQDAVKKNKINKIISFHPTIAHSENFVGEKEISVKHRLKDFDLYNVSSKQNMGVRRSTMSAFRKADTALISNAQCLNEGVDVPAVDMVAFMSPKRSKVSIVQAVGRAIRKPRGSDKEWGYVFVPIFLEKASGETDVEAAERSNFKDMYEVINALRDHDEVLDEVIKNLRIEKGNKGKFNGRILDDYIQIIGFDLSIENLEKDIQSEVIDRISSNWYEMFGVLKKYSEDYGHCLVPVNYTNENGKKLGSWVNTQRTGKNKLNDERKKLLESLSGWSWDVLDDIWRDLYNGICKYQEANGHLRIPRGYIDKNKRKLGNWIRKQRINRSVLSAERKNKLEDLNTWYWNWYDEPIRLLKSFIEKNGHSRIDRDFKTNCGFKLGMWVYLKRLQKDSLDHELISILEKIPDWTWENPESISHKWEDGFLLLKRYVDIYGHARWRQYKRTDEAIKIKNWIREQKTRFNKGVLSNINIKKLNSINVWHWNDWDEGFRLLKEYYKTHSQNPPSRYKTPCNFALSDWIYRQLKNDKLSKEKRKKLESLENWTWETDKNKELFMEGYIRLKKYKEDVGNLFMPRDYTTEDGFNLGMWYATRRLDYKKGRLKRYKINLLNQLDVVWNPHDYQWEQTLMSLKLFREKYGHTTIPTSERNLYAWVREQKKLIIDGNLQKERIKKFHEIYKEKEIDLEAEKDKKWDLKFSRLKKYLKKNNQFPTKDNYALYKWCLDQRKQIKNNELDKNKVDQLISIGFKIKTHFDKWEENFNLLKQYLDNNGHINIPQTGPNKHPILSQWITKNRSNYKAQKLKKDKIVKLESLGFKWSGRVKRKN